MSALPHETQLAMIRERLFPLAQELGFDAFVLTGYLRLENDQLQRVCIAGLGNNPAYEDGLRPLISYAQIWGAQAASGAPPPKMEGS